MSGGLPAEVIRPLPVRGVIAVLGSRRCRPTTACRGRWMELINGPLRSPREKQCPPEALVDRVEQLAEHRSECDQEIAVESGLLCDVAVVGMDRSVADLLQCVQVRRVDLVAPCRRTAVGNSGRPEPTAQGGGAVLRRPAASNPSQVRLARPLGCRRALMTGTEQFIASLVNSLAWPGAVAVAVAFRRQIGALLSSSLKRLKAGPVEFEFDRVIASAEANLGLEAGTAAGAESCQF